MKFLVLFAIAASACGQDVEIAPFAGGGFASGISITQTAQSNISSSVRSALTLGVATGVALNAGACDDCNVLEFRWMWERTHLGFNDDALNINYFLVDFTREFATNETKERFRPFLTTTFGAARLSPPNGSSGRFVFGIGGGVDVFPKPRWGFRIMAEYLPIVAQANLRTTVCAAGCLVFSNGALINQLQVSIGPVARF
jgi:hypothetical protein